MAESSGGKAQGKLGAGGGVVLRAGRGDDRASLTQLGSLPALASGDVRGDRSAGRSVGTGEIAEVDGLRGGDGGGDLRGDRDHTTLLTFSGNLTISHPIQRRIHMETGTIFFYHVVFVHTIQLRHEQLFSFSL